MQKNYLWVMVAGAVVAGLGYMLTRPPQITSQPQPKTVEVNELAESVTELKVEDIVEGSGNPVVTGDTVVVHYTGTLTDGTKFDSSLDRGQPFETQIGVGAVIEGWDKGIVGMKAGGRRRLVIPAHMGYGSRGAGSIPPNSDLIFEVELVEIK